MSAYNRPSLETLRDRVMADIRAVITEARGSQRRALLRALAQASAGLTHGLYGYLDWVAERIVPINAEGDILRAWASSYGLRQREADKATGTAEVEGDDGAIVPADTLLEHADGHEYRVTEDAVVEGGIAELALEAEEAGSDANIDAGETLSFVNTVDGIEPEAEVGDDGISGGADDESEDDFRDRLILRMSNPPGAGNRSDYERWARDAHPDIDRAWPSPRELGPGTITVRIAVNGDDPVPGQQIIDTVEEYILERCPATAEEGLNILAPKTQAVDVTVRLSPDTQEARDRIEEAVQEYLRTIDPGSRLHLPALSGFIWVAAGESQHEVIEPADSIEFSKGYIPVLGDLNWETEG